MRSVAAGALAVSSVIATGACATQSAPPADTSPATTLTVACAEGLESACRLEVAAANLDAWWAERLPDYETARLIVLDGPTPSACGPLGPGNLAVYCGADQSVYLAVQELDELTEGGRGAIFVLAHEWAHHAQHLAGLDVEQAQASRTVPELAPALSVAYELMADCLAGAWLTSADDTATSGAVDAEDYLSVMALVGALADEGELPDGITLVPETFTHGNANQRQAWTVIGFGSTALNADPISACDTFESLFAAIEQRATLNPSP